MQSHWTSRRGYARQGERGNLIDQLSRLLELLAGISKRLRQFRLCSDIVGEGFLQLRQLVVRCLARGGKPFCQPCIRHGCTHQIIGGASLGRHQPCGLESGFKAAELRGIGAIAQIIIDAGQRGKGCQQDGAYGDDDRARQLDFLYARAHMMRCSHWNGYVSSPF